MKDESLQNPLQWLQDKNLDKMYIWVLDTNYLLFGEEK